MKKLLCAYVSCVLMLAPHLSHQAALVDSSSSFPSPTTDDRDLGRKSLKEVGFPPPNCAGKEKAEMIHRTKESKLKVSSLGNERKKHEEGEGLIIYSADYSLVSTHPPPLHKHKHSEP